MMQPFLFTMVSLQNRFANRHEYHHMCQLLLYTMFGQQLWREKKEVEGKGREGKRIGRNNVLFVQEGREGKGREVRVFPLNLFNVGKINTLTKNIHQSYKNPFPPILLSKQRIAHLSKSLPFLSIHFLPSIDTLRVYLGVRGLYLDLIGCVGLRVTISECCRRWWYLVELEEKNYYLYPRQE